ncbi:hypothetical protein C943_00560 [Mariniradius saccharolyticus AK6]|uniref:Uncharacterized protein n=1 Tax=Mariniradius saccharolyticus AK6 TaxID=1239962 RepID=M7XXR5_9BACT|nr:hypothetical protein C943_00560 [Mariniradius saccharolyticus AK6]
MQEVEKKSTCVLDVFGRKCDINRLRERMNGSRFRNCQKADSIHQRHTRVLQTIWA